MIGADIAQADGKRNVVLFNSQPGQTPPPITSTSYTFSGPATAKHTLCGLAPGGRYTVSRAGTVVTVSRDETGPLSASSAGILQFTLAPADVQLTLFYPRLVTTDRTGSGPDNSEYTGIAIANLDAADATLTFTAFDTTGARIAGPSVANPSSMTLKQGAQLPIVDFEVFGAGLAERKPTGWIKVESTVKKIVGFFLTFNGTLSFLDGADVSSTTLSSFILPEIEDVGFTQIHAANPDASSATLTIDLLKADGTSRSPPVTRTVSSNGALAASFAELFPGVAAASSDYLRVTSTRGVVPFQYLGKTGVYAEGLNGQDTAAGAATLYCPQYVVGGGVYRTTVSVVNLDSTSGTVSFRFIRDDGAQIGATRSVAIAARGKIYLTDPSFFVDAGNTLTQGYLEISSSGPRLTGSVVFSDPDRARFSTALPLVARLQTAVIFSQVASNATYFTGIALLNPGTADATVRIEVFDRNGILVRSGTQTIKAANRVARLLTQYFTDLAGVDISSGYIKAGADRGVAGFALFGTNNLTDPTQSLALSAVPPQLVP